MVEKLGFATALEAKALRDEYFQKYHSTMKGLTVATEEGRLPKPFNKDELGLYWAEHCDFEKYVKPNPGLADDLKTLIDAGINVVAFSNSPRAYAMRVLESLGVRAHFKDELVFAVEDVLPACKPQPEAFQQVLNAVGSSPGRALMVEDSMKNIRACKSLGMWTVLIDEACDGKLGGEAALLGDIPDRDDPAVDVAISNINQLRSALPGLWEKKFTPQRVAAE
eukprot:TRINITY_DN30194_c0_g1_i3.p1 TRINITY_DN30194_c0_g1~~TRINITY_DN30194_c0_g1_i3.p1  ORF type:complete len:223 (-),score=58.50 TRINITY_DN30194_c0_g1_i3:134-802(-)